MEFPTLTTRNPASDEIDPAGDSFRPIPYSAVIDSQRFRVAATGIPSPDDRKRLERVTALPCGYRNQRFPRSPLAADPAMKFPTLATLFRALRYGRFSRHPCVEIVRSENGELSHPIPADSGRSQYAEFQD
jgi:hypothetical protein